MASSYLNYITSQHRSQPRFAAVVEALTSPLLDGMAMLRAMVEAFDLDQASGAQLDAIGLWVGVSRTVPLPLTGVYFEWDGAASVGWDNGFWKGEFDPATGPVVMDDANYRTMIRAKIAANFWDGTFERLYETWVFVFGEDVIEVLDNQDMSLTVVYDDLALSTVEIALLLGGAYPLKPMGVKMNFVALSGAPIFSWDRALPKFQGWTGISVWI